MRKEFGELKGEDDGVIAYDEEDTIYKIQLRDMSLEQVIDGGVSVYDKKKDPVQQNVRIPQILERNIRAIAKRNKISRYRAVMFIMKRGNAEIEEVLHGKPIAWVKQLCTDIALCIPRVIEREALLNITSIEWDLSVLAGGKHTTIRMPWYVGGQKEEIETNMDMKPSDVTKLMLAAGISRSENCRTADNKVLKETIKKVESMALQQNIVIDGIIKALPDILQDTFTDEQIKISTRMERFDELQDVFLDAKKYHLEQMEKFITTELMETLENLNTFFRNEV